MNDSDDEGSTLDSGYATPPLSPSKTVSTEGWMSPRTPCSPRKTRSCLFFRDTDADSHLPTPPDSPTKANRTSRLRALRLSDVHRFSPQVASPLSEDNCSIKQRLVDLGGSPLRHSVPLALSTCRSLPCTVNTSSQTSDHLSDGAPSLKTFEPATTSPINSAQIDEDRSNHSPTTERPSLSSSLPGSATAISSDDDSPERPANISNNANTISPTKLNRLPIRHASSPLRPSQWVARGGLLSPPRRQTQTPDRFIPSRRPPHVSRESFELNKPAERLIAADRITRGGSSGVDPFSRRLRRSGRLNEELRSLRETHSVLSGRANLERQGTRAGLRRGSFTVGMRQVSAGAVWNVGGSSAVSDTVVGVSTGRGGMLGSGTNAPLYTSMFLSRSDPEAELEAYERRLALALDVDQTDRVLEHSTPPQSSSSTPSPAGHTKHVWRDNTWTRDGVAALLDAPQLRDDYYCSLLAYSHTAKCLAVGLGNFVHLWSERKGVDTPESLNALSTASTTDAQHVTSLAFSSSQGSQAILAVGRADGRIALWSPFDTEPRFDATQPKPISCVSFRPTTVKRPSLRDRAMTVPTEELLIGDEVGNIYFYSIEWPSETESAIFGWHGSMTLLARMAIHTQQICGLSWSIDGEYFASGGNDNACYLFETKKAFQPSSNTTERSTTLDVRPGPNGESIYTVTPGNGTVLHIPNTQAKHKWELNAAVKAIAFCPWQRGLLAIGGGSNDRCIHFYHTVSGACLATIDCAAQVTSLIWSQTRREIAATFGFAQPEHPYRIAVFAWPTCEQVVAVPWFDEHRALYAVPYPGGPDSGGTPSPKGGRTAGEDGVWWKRGAEEGCIVVAASDAAIRFHEIWTGGTKRLSGGAGLLGGSDILEGLHGIEREGEATIR